MLVAEACASTFHVWYDSADCTYKVGETAIIEYIGVGMSAAVWAYENSVGESVDPYEGV